MCGVLMGSAYGADEACVYCYMVRCCKVCVGCLCRVRLLLMGHACAVDRHVMAACDFNMLFTFVLPGWEGAAHDTHIFYFS